MTHVVLVFLDGVGLGPAGASNPLSTAERPHLKQVAGDQAWTDALAPLDTETHVCRPIDATLGVEGLPQSGTGQATLFTGANCAQVVGRHYGPFPHSATFDLLAERNVFTQISRLPRAAPTAFANAYPPRFFEHAEKRGRWTVTTRCCREADLPVRTLDDLARGEAVAADLTGAGLRRLGHDVSVRSAQASGRDLASLAAQHAFTLFEYFLTDKAGHGRIDRAPTAILDDVDAFLGGLLDAFDPAEGLLLITSDHGNIEDTSTKTHTRHPVPLIAYGAGAHHFRTVQSLTDVTPAVVQALSARPS